MGKILKTLGLYKIAKSMMRGRRSSRRTGLFALAGGSGILPTIAYLAWRNRDWIASKWSSLGGTQKVKALASSAGIHGRSSSTKDVRPSYAGL
jgi:hypothetical protein